MILKPDYEDEDRAKALIDEFLCDDFPIEEVSKLLRATRPKQLKLKTDFTRYS